MRGGGQYTLKFRKVSEEVNTVPSTWNTLIFEKNSPAYDLIFEESTLKWKTGREEHIRGYSLIKNGVESSTSFSVSGYNVVFGDIDNSSQISYSVVVLGDFTGTSFRGIPVLDSEPSESFVAARLNKPDIWISQGIVYWSDIENAISYTVYDGDIKTSIAYNSSDDGAIPLMLISSNQRLIVYLFTQRVAVKVRMAYMNLSKSDIAGCKAGLLFAIAVFALIPVICALISIKDLSVMNLVCGAMTLGGIYYVSCLCLGILFSVFDVILAFIVGLIVSLFQKIIPHRKKA